MNPREIFRDLPLEEIERLLIIRRAMQPMSTPIRRAIMQTMGMIGPPESPDAGKPYEVRLNDV